MAKTEAKETRTEAQGEATVSLAFRVVRVEDGLFGAEMILIHDGKIVASRRSPGTTMGHAIGAADNLLDAWALNEMDQTPDQFFKEVFV